MSNLDITDGKLHIKERIYCSALCRIQSGDLPVILGLELSDCSSTNLSSY